jgi:photosystem II stability/assembly factor-like uncharacterized protein
MKQLNKYKPIFTDFLFYIAILFFIIGFNFSDNMAGGWYQQFMPNLNGRQISDIFFLDSLNGWAVTPYRFQNDTAYVLKTTNSGDNWFIANTRIGQFVGYNKVYFLNSNTGFICGVYQTSVFKALSKTIDGGFNWFPLNPPDVTYNDMKVLNADTIWLAANESLIGGVYRTTNAGANWEQQINLGSDNPDHIYMYNGKLGFIAKLQIYLRRTTDGGANWTLDTTGSDSGFRDMYFADSLTGWKNSFFGIKKTTNGGLNWFLQLTAQGGIIQTSFIGSFSNVNRDTIWGSGGYVLYPNNQTRPILHRTTNGGNNWLFQIPDTSINIGYAYVNFVNRLNGWAYSSNGKGIHTTTGGDTIWYFGIQQLSNNIPKDFILKQNYPNPFNPRTIIPYSLKSSAHVKLIAYDILGKEVQRLVDNYQQAGEYEVDFMGKFTATGVYFYQMTADDKIIDTKKMLLIK